MPTVSDSFDRADGALGANWTTVPFSTNNFAIASNEAISTAFGGSAVYHNGYSSATGAGTLFSEALEGAAPTDQGLVVALYTGGDQGYVLRRSSTGSMGIQRNGSYVGAGYTPGSFVAGTLRLEYTRSTGLLVAKLNGATVITHTDGSPLAIERVGMGQAGLGDATASFLSWSGGDDVAGDTTAPTITGPGGATGATSAINIPELTTAVHTFTANEAVTWDLNGGADVARFTINAGGALSFLSAPNFEAPNDTGTNNTYEVGVRATDGSANATTQTVTITITNLNEAPTFTGTISVPAPTEGVAMTPYATAGFYGDPDAGDTAAYSAIGSWPAGVTVNSSTGVISGTPTTPGTYASLQVRRTDAGALTVNSNSFTITVAAAGGVTFTGTVPAKSGTVGTAFDFGSPTMASYFSGAGTYALQAGTLPPGLSVNPTTGAVTGTPTTAGTYAGISVRKTATSGSPATADTNTFTITIAAAPVVPGFDFHTASGLVFGAISGSLVGLAREVGVSITTRVYDASTAALVATLTPTATDSNGRLPRLTSGSLTAATTYVLTFVWPDGSVYSIRMATT